MTSAKMEEQAPRTLSPKETVNNQAKTVKTNPCQNSGEQQK